MTGVCYFCDMFLTYLKGRSIIFWRLFLRFSYQSEASKQYFLHFQIQAFSLWSKFVCFSFQMFFSPQSPSQTWQHPADWMKRMLGLNSHKIQHLPSGFFFFFWNNGKTPYYVCNSLLCRCCQGCSLSSFTRPLLLSFSVSLFELGNRSFYK